VVTRARINVALQVNCIITCLPSLLRLTPQTSRHVATLLWLVGPSVSFPGFPKHTFQRSLAFKSSNQSLWRHSV